jgi:aryl-alcohol dehydrogenase-like predicted oxidoreductase
MLETKEFGRTGHLSTRLLFGAAAFYSTTDEDEVKRTMDMVEAAGINHIDTAKSYGESERLLGPWLKHNRSKVFLATKTESRGYKEAKEDIQRSLDLLQTDHVDLWQMH